MEKLSIDLPESFHFSTDIQVQMKDLNFVDHVGNDTYVSYLNEVMIRFLTSIGVPIRSSIMADMAIIYKSEAYYGEILKGETAVAGFTNDSCYFYFRVSKKEAGKEVFRARARMVFFDYLQRKRIDIPDNLKQFS
jgi:acyl-CoA thioester hydrolase